MKIALCYPYIANKAEKYRPVLRRFMETYLKLPAGVTHDLWIQVCGGASVEKCDLDLIPDLPLHNDYYGDGWDIGAHQHTANCLPPEYDFMVCCCAHTYFHREGWLKRLVEARELHGPGLYGAMASYEHYPHIRTCFFGCDPRDFRAYPNVINSRQATLDFENGPENFGIWMKLVMGLSSFMVTWDGVAEAADWRKPDNIFRRGDESNCLVWDNHTRAYLDAPAEERASLAKLADGV